MRWNAAARRRRYGAAFAGKAVAHWVVIYYNLSMRMGAGRDPLPRDEKAPL